MIGQTLGHFRIDAALGKGGMGVVYRATDLALGRGVALKVLPDALVPGESDAGERKRRFLREARAAAAVTHPSIATIYEVGEADGQVFIAMELILGTTLRDQLASGLGRAEALALAAQIAAGLGCAHDAGIVHRDLKPENVMVTSQGDAKILDFGLAKLQGVPAADGVGETTSQLTGVGQIMGTPPYMSPEQATGNPAVDARTDVFSFGVLLYELLTGIRPFRGTTLEILYGIAHSDPLPLEAVREDIPPALAAVVARCLRKPPAERFASGRELLSALRAAIATGSATTPASGPQLMVVGGLGTALGSTYPPGQTPAALAANAPPRPTPAVLEGRSLGIAIGGLVAALIAVAGAGVVAAMAPRSSPQAGAAASGAPPSPREAYLEAAHVLKDGSYQEPKPLAECQAAYDTYKKLLPVVKPSGWDNDPVKFVPGNVRMFAPGCFARAGSCEKAWEVYREAWRLDPLLAPESHNLDDQALRGGFEALQRDCPKQ